MTADRSHRHDTGSRLEDAGIPDLQDGTPEQQQAEDPQELPLPGDAPNASVDWGTTVEEQLEGEPHDVRLAREEPDPVLEEINGAPRRGQDFDDADDADAADDAEVGRLVHEERLQPGDTQPDTDAIDVGMDGGGLTQEERAIHLEPE
jgi:hypothetical protein